MIVTLISHSATFLSTKRIKTTETIATTTTVTTAITTNTTSKKC